MRARKINARMRVEIPAGVTASLEMAIRFTDWADQMGPRLTPAAIKGRYGCSRATSYRWFAAYRAARRNVEADAA